MVTWYSLLQKAMIRDGEDFLSRKCTLSEEELKVEFDWSDSDTAKPFTAWGEHWVYFPIGYDDMVWVGHAPRFPSKVSMFPQGGGCREPIPSWQWGDLDEV